MNVPFISATKSGPIHFIRTLTIADIQALARGETSPAEPAVAKKKKKRWWQF